MKHAVIAVSPDGSLLAFAHGSQVRLFNARLAKFVALAHDEKDSTRTAGRHTGTIRAVKIDGQSRQMMTCGDDKLVLVWNCVNGECIARKLMPKKLSAGYFCRDGRIIVGDKTGVVHALSLPTNPANGTSNEKGPPEMHVDFVLGHFSTVTDIQILTFPDKKKLIATADVEKKIVVSRFPGSFEIESICFGHTSYVTTLDKTAFETEDKSKIPLLVSGGGDGSVRLWETKTARLLDTFGGLKSRNPIPTHHTPANKAQPDKKSNSMPIPNWPKPPISHPGATARKPTAPSTSPEDPSSPTPAQPIPKPCPTPPPTPTQQITGGKRAREGIGEKADENGLEKGIGAVAEISTSRINSLVAVRKAGLNKIEVLRVEGGMFRLMTEIEFDTTPLCIAFDPAAHLWVLVLRGNSIGAEVFGVSHEDEMKMEKLEVHKTLQAELFPKLDENAQPLLVEFINMYHGRKSRKKMRTDRHLEPAKKASNPSVAVAVASSVSGGSKAEEEREVMDIEEKPLPVSSHSDPENYH